MKLKGFLKRRNSKRPLALLIMKNNENIEVIWCEDPDNIEEQYLCMTVMDYKKEDDCTEVWLVK